MMKNKLEKTNHKKAYYSMRKAGIGFAVSVSILSLAAIPVISAVKTAVPTKAAEEPVVETVDEAVENIDLSLSYEE